ncbi:hypothetical protein SCOR_26010 [Sulfidibacter corallicola]
MHTNTIIHPHGEDEDRECGFGNFEWFPVRVRILRIFEDSGTG